jgi:hypothetical protein
MTDLEKVKRAFESVVWMAIRYANGRHTTAPSTVREAVALYQEVEPDWRPGPDHTLKTDRAIGFVGEPGSVDSDYLDDLVAIHPDTVVLGRF